MTTTDNQAKFFTGESCELLVLETAPLDDLVHLCDLTFHFLKGAGVGARRAGDLHLLRLLHPPVRIGMTQSMLQ